MMSNSKQRSRHKRKWNINLKLKKHFYITDHLSLISFREQTHLRGRGLRCFLSNSTEMCLFTRQ